MPALSTITKIATVAVVALLATTMTASAVVGFYTKTTKQPVLIFSSAAVSVPIGRLNKGVTVHVLQCTPQFCRIDSPKVGWVRRGQIQLPVY